MDHTIVFTLGCGWRQNQQCKKYTYFDGNFDSWGCGCTMQGTSPNIAKWSTSRASLEAPGCHHQASAWDVSPGGRHG